MSVAAWAKRAVGTVIVAILMCATLGAQAQQSDTEKPSTEITSNWVAPVGQEKLERIIVRPGATQDVSLELGYLTEIETSNSLSKVMVGDDKIVDVMPRTDRTLILIPKAVGSTNIYIYDASRNRIAVVSFTVKYPGLPHTIQVYNKAMLNSYTTFACATRSCQFIGEKTVDEPAPLPSGYSNNTSHSTLNNESSPKQSSPNQ